MPTSYSPKDLDILTLLAQARYLTTRQLVALFFRDSQHSRTQFRRANLVLNKLKNRGLIAHLDRRIGGVRAGSGSFVWYILPKGLKLLNLGIRQKNKYEPSAYHLEHTLAISQVYVQLKVLEILGKLQIETFQFEPRCHRSYATLSGRSISLKPDALATVLLEEYEDAYFLEIDQATESLNRVLNQCKKYIGYFKTGIEQRERGVFPLVVWIVPSEKRKLAIQTKLQEELDNFWQMFQVLTLEELDNFMKGDRDENTTERE